MSEPTSKGILTFAFGIEYQKQAYCQALTAARSLQLPLTAIVDVLEYPPLATVANVKVLEGRWAKFEYEQLALELTDYDVTFKTDADMLFPQGSMLYHPEHLPFSSGVATDIFDNVTASTAYRETAVAMGLPTVYSAVFSFDRRTEEAQQFFQHLRYVYKHWYGLQIWDYLPPLEKKLPPTTDTAYSLAHLYVAGATCLDGNQFIHAKPYINSWKDDEWTSVKTFTVDTQNRMYLDGVRLSSPLHYYDKALITDAFIERLEHVCSL